MIEFSKRRYDTAADHFANAGDQRGLGLRALGLSRTEAPAARAAFTKDEDHSGRGLCVSEEADFATTEEEFAHSAKSNQ